MSPAFRALLLSIIGMGLLLGAFYLLTGGTERIEISARQFVDAYFREDGDQLMQAYGAMTTGYAADTPMREFYDQQNYYLEILGAFQGVVGEVSESIEPDGVGHLEMRLAFENGEVDAVFDFRKEKKRWRIRDFDLVIPRSMAPERPWVEPQNFGRTLSSRWAQGGHEGVWKLFTLELRKKKDKELFGERTTALVEPLGAFQSVEDGALDTSNADEPTMSYTVKFANGERRTDVALVWRKGRWLVTHFEVEGLSLD